MKYGVGDVVLVRNDLSGGEIWDSLNVSKGMLFWCGNLLTIIDVESFRKNNETTLIHYRVLENQYAWSEEMFVTSIDPKNLVHCPNCGTSIGFFGVAKTEV